MNGKDLRDGFDLDHHTVLHEQIDPIGEVELEPEVREGALGEWQDVLPFGARRAVEAACLEHPPDVVWSRLREQLVAWALGKTVGGSGRRSAYSPRERYAEGDVVDHPRCGAGTVTCVDATKVDVAFADGPRTRVHARS